MLPLKFSLTTLDVSLYGNMMTQRSHIIDSIEATTTREQLLDVYSNFIGQYGFTSLIVAQLFNPLLAKDPVNQILITNWSLKWQGYWWENGYYEHDPIVHYLLKTQKLFSWDVAYRHASKIGKKIFQESQKFGFTNGIAFPVSTDVGSLGIVSLGADVVTFEKKIIATIQTVSKHTYKHLVRLSNSEAANSASSFTKRETEIMHLVSQGKTNGEIAKILELSEETIKSYLKLVSQKLNTVNRAHAVSEAIRKGLIIG